MRADGPAAYEGPANTEIARIFRDTADLLEVARENPFRIRAYRNAARVVEDAPQSVAQLVRAHPEQLTELPAIGDDLAGKITEIVRTGALALHDTLAQQAPAGAAALLAVSGIGPARARALADGLGIRSLAGLRRAAQAGRVRTLPGFGARLEARLLEELTTAGGVAERRWLRARAAQYGEALRAWMLTGVGVTRAELAGSFRRCRETVGDLDLLVEATDGRAAVAHFLLYPALRRVSAHGATRAAAQLAGGLRVDLRVLPSASYGAALHYFTGSKAHNIAVRALGRTHGLRISEYGVFRGSTRIGGREEAEVFAAVGLPWIPPELREMRGELEAARRGALPSLIALDDIRGDLQMHTTDSDGRDTLEAMAAAAAARGYAYIAVTDHTPSLRITRGLDADGFRRQRQRIDRLNAASASLTILQGAEVDIRPDGSLDLDDRTLDALDIVLVSLHSSLPLAPARQTARIIRALRHPRVHVFAHPRGRLINGRAGARFDLDAVVHVAVEEGVLLEINAQPERLDLDDLAARRAQELGASFVISTDAHHTAELAFMRWGVEQARRGWIERSRVANAGPLDALLRRLRPKR